MSKMMETDNNGDVRRGAKQIKLSGHKFISDKSCKDRIKKLSAVNKVNGRNEEKYEMACAVADREPLHSQSPSPSDAPSKKLKLPKKQFFDDFNGVDHFSVPRKLRSAMKRRNGESSSSPFPDSKKLNYSSGGVKSFKKKQGGPSWSLQQSEVPITKDEEEVVETLYALAGMFPDSETDKTGNASLDASASVLAGPSDSLAHKLEALEQDVDAHCLSKIDEDVDHADDRERLPENTIEACSLGGPSIRTVSNFSNSEKLRGLDRSIVHMKLNKMFNMNEEQKPRGNSVNFCFPLEPYQDNGKVKQPAIAETSLLETKPDTALGLTTPFGQVNQHNMTNEPNRNASWTGFSSTLTTTSHGPLSRSCSAKVPAWFTTRPGSLETDSSTGTEFKVPIDRRSRKKCASHIYISRLIKSLQAPETKESLELLPNNPKPQQALKQGVHTTTNDFRCSKTDSTSRVETPETNLYDHNSGDLQHLWLQKEHPHADLASGAYNSQKQSFNFLSLSAGGGDRMESSVSYNNRVERRPESMATMLIPYQAQNPALVPFSMYQARATCAYPLQPSAAAVQQAQPQLHPNFKALTKQQQLWASQMAQYRNTGTSTAMVHFPSMQNGRRQGSPAMVQCMAPSPINVEPLGPKYPHVSRQQQQQHQYQHQQYVGFSLEHGRLKRQDHHLSSLYDDTELGFRVSGGSLPMQLLCNEHL